MTMSNSLSSLIILIIINNLITINGQLENPSNFPWARCRIPRRDFFCLGTDASRVAYTSGSGCFLDDANCDYILFAAIDEARPDSNGHFIHWYLYVRGVDTVAQFWLSKDNRRPTNTIGGGVMMPDKNLVVHGDTFPDNSLETFSIKYLRESSTTRDRVTRDSQNAKNGFNFGATGDWKENGAPIGRFFEVTSRELIEFRQGGSGTLLYSVDVYKNQLYPNLLIIKPGLFTDLYLPGTLDIFGHVRNPQTTTTTTTSTSTTTTTTTTTLPPTPTTSEPEETTTESEIKTTVANISSSSTTTLNGTSEIATKSPDRTSTLGGGDDRSDTPSPVGSSNKMTYIIAGAAIVGLLVLLIIITVVIVKSTKSKNRRQADIFLRRGPPGSTRAQTYLATIAERESSSRQSKTSKLDEPLSFESAVTVVTKKKKVVKVPSLELSHHDSGISTASNVTNASTGGLSTYFTK